jgi:sulfopyruvate decarboxylase TPP-binding subunit
MFTGPEIAAALIEIGITHVIWVPDTTIGPWEAALESSPKLQLVRVCREGEAWPLAAGLYLGGKTPLVLMQCTGLFESGDALRNVHFDLKLPILSIIGVRNALVPASRDSAKRFAEPILQAWQVDYRWIKADDQKPLLIQYLAACRREFRAGTVLLAEGAA